MVEYLNLSIAISRKIEQIVLNDVTLKTNEYMLVGHDKGQVKVKRVWKWSFKTIFTTQMS